MDGEGESRRYASSQSQAADVSNLKALRGALTHKQRPEIDIGRNDQELRRRIADSNVIVSNQSIDSSRTADREADGVRSDAIVGINKVGRGCIRRRAIAEVP